MVTEVFILYLKFLYYFTEEKKRLPVEVQLRTIAMDFWASIEHKLRYKKNLPETVSADIAESLRSCSDKINEMDFRMQAINRWIELSKTEGFSEEGTKNNN